MNSIIKDVALRHGINPRKVLVSGGRSAKYVLARSEAIEFMVRGEGMTVVQAASILGYKNNDHTSILHHLNSKGRKYRQKR